MAKLVAKIQGLANEIANVKRNAELSRENEKAIVARTVRRQGIHVSAGKAIDRHRPMCVGRVIARVVCVRVSVRVIALARPLFEGKAKEIGTVLLRMSARVGLLLPNYHAKPSDVRS